MLKFVVKDVIVALSDLLDIQQRCSAIVAFFHHFHQRLMAILCIAVVIEWLHLCEIECLIAHVFRASTFTGGKSFSDIVSDVSWDFYILLVEMFEICTAFNKHHEHKMHNYFLNYFLAL